MQSSGLRRSDGRCGRSSGRTDAADTIRKELPGKYFEGFRREEAMQTYEGIAMQFTRSKGYLTIQATEEGYSFIFMTLICMKSRVVIMIIQTHPFRKLLMKSLKVKEWMMWNVSKWIIKNLKK